MRELAPEPTPQQFAEIAHTIAPGASVISTRQLTGGISCRMDVLKFATAQDEAREVVVRQYGPWHEKDDPHPGTIEAEVLRHLDSYQIGAPKIVLENKAFSILGRRAIVTSLVDGKPIVQPDDQARWAGQLVDAIVSVHELPVPDELQRVVPSLYTAMDRLFGRSEPTDEIKKHPLGPKLWEHLKTLWPSVDRSGAQLIHADYWPGNTLWKDNELVAIVDWEEPRIGTPTWDVAIVVQDAAIFGMDIEKTVLEQHRRTSSRALTDYRFWRMYVAMSEMPDPGRWVEGYLSMGGGGITPDEVRANHAATIERMLAG